MARILVIEDSVVNLDLMTYLLRAFGYVVDTAMDGAQGLAQARAQRPDLILCDIQMPVLDGLGFNAAAAADPALRTIPRVAVTAYAMVGDRERFLAAGFDGYFSKPIDPTQFVGQVEAFVAPELRAPARA